MHRLAQSRILSVSLQLFLSQEGCLVEHGLAWCRELDLPHILHSELVCEKLLQLLLAGVVVGLLLQSSIHLCSSQRNGRLVRLQVRRHALH